MIVSDFVARGVSFSVTGDDQLKVRAPEGLLTAEDWQELKARKAEIIRDLRLAEARRLYTEVNEQVTADGRFKVRRDATVELPCVLIDQVIHFRVADARLRVDDFTGCIQAAGRCQGPVRCYHCDRGHTFVKVEGCKHA